MKKLLILLFSILISFNSYANWKLLFENNTGDGYIDKETIKEHSGYVYFWFLQNKHSPDGFPGMSVKVYGQGDCKIDRMRSLNYTAYKEQMGEGEIEEEFTPDNPEWEFMAPDSLGGFYLNYVCNYVN